MLGFFFAYYFLILQNELLYKHAFIEFNENGQ